MGIYCRNPKLWLPLLVTSEFFWLFPRVVLVQLGGSRDAIAPSSHPSLMGNRGYKVYRSKGRYLVYYIHSVFYPSHFGLYVANEIPRGVSKEEFEEWVRSTRDTLDADYEELKKNSEGGDVFVTVHRGKPELLTVVNLETNYM